jgi:hypothetical protein
MTQIKPKNYYTIIPDKYKKSTTNTNYSNYDKVQIPKIFRALLIGSCGSGKTNILMDILHNINAYERILLYAKNLDQPLYKFLIDACEQVEKQTGQQVLVASEDTDDIPTITDPIFDGRPAICIFDDLLCESKSVLTKISNLYVQGRNKNVALCFLSQSYYDIPKLIRSNANYIFLRRIASKKDFTRMIKEYALDDIPEKDLWDVYNKIMSKEMNNFMLIDLNTTDPNIRYRYNYTPLKLATKSPIE